jgi:hypothetical protein
MKKFIFKLENSLYDVQEENSKLIKEVNSTRNNPLEEPLLTKVTEELKLDANLIDLYRSYNGLKINWAADDERTITGRMHFLSMEEITKSWEGYLYEDDEVAANADIRFFHPFDLISDEAQCGIIIKPNSDIKSIFYNYSGEMEIYSLDIDFKGYLEMALEAKVFFYWSTVLLDIKNDEESEETKKFKEEMPKIFKDFNYSQFIDKYNSLRLSNN